jgi:hypothetical protein
MMFNTTFNKPAYPEKTTDLLQLKRGRGESFERPRLKLYFFIK